MAEFHYTKEFFKEFFKNYGAVIGPFCAFCFGIIAIYFKGWYDEKSNKRKTESKLKKLYKMVLSKSCQL
jgi:hypothetical protein